jgi:hypothetical protein
MLNALFVTDGWIFVRRAGPGLRRIFTTVAVHVVEMFGFRVIRFQLVVADGPGGRETAVMANLAEIFLTQAEERRAVKFGVAADVIVCMRMKFLAVSIAPRFFRVVLAFEIDGARAPVVLLTRNVVAAFE